MFKISYEGEPYYYNSGKQAYTAKAEITMDNDATLSDILEAVLKMSEFATYPKQTKSHLKEYLSLNRLYIHMFQLTQYYHMDYNCI